MFILVDYKITPTALNVGIILMVKKTSSDEVKKNINDVFAIF